MLCIEGRVALTTFTVFSLLTLYQIKILYGDYWSSRYNGWVILSAITCILFLPYNGIMKRSALLGALVGGCFILTPLLAAPWNRFTMYMFFLAFFHFSEYMMTAIYNEHRLSLDSFLLNHSREYQIAAVASWVEFYIEAKFFPSMKNLVIINFIGLIMVIGGETFRKLAMVTAKSNFSHIVQSTKAESHQLVTHGVYSFTRHPSYFGWYYWSVGTQILLMNPICAVAYAWASYKFFKERIEDEEYHLLQFFGDDYINYILTVPTRLPFIQGLEPRVRRIPKPKAS